MPSPASLNSGYTSCRRRVISRAHFLRQLKSNGQSGRQPKVTPLKVRRPGLNLVRLKAPTEQPHQSEIRSHPQSFSERGIRLWLCRTVFPCVYGADQGLRKRPQPSDRCSPPQTELEITLARIAILSAEVRNSSKIAKVLFLSG